MATITQENIGLLNDKITVRIGKEDYFSSFEKSLKNYSKSASLPGFRKGMVPAGVIKKMHGQSVFTDEVLKTVEKELGKYLDEKKLEIFAQPLPLPENDASQLDVNHPQDYAFAFEVGLKPAFTVADLSKETVPHYKIIVTDDMIDQQVERMRKGYGKKKDPEGGDSDENIEQAELNEEFFKAAYPGKEIHSEEDLRKEIRADIENYWEGQSRNQLQHAIYHRLLDHSPITFPENFLRRWMENGTDKPKTPEEVEKEFPNFVNELKWSLITDRIGREQNIQVGADDIREFAKKQLFGYMGMNGGDIEQQPWVNDYLDKMMKDRKFVDDSYYRIRTEKLFEWAEQQVKKEEKPITAEDFGKMVQEHHHHDHGHDHEHDHDHEGHSHDH